MSLSLLTAYSDDEDDNEISDSSAVADAGASTSLKPTAEKNESFFFNEDEASDSSDDETSSRKRNSNYNSEEPPVKKMLPSARDLFTSNTIKSSVFMSEQQREESVHHARLSQHVPLTEQIKVASTKSKQNCKEFRKGSCKRGKKCKFFHPPPVTPEQLEEATIKSQPRMYTSTEEVLNGKTVNIVK